MKHVTIYLFVAAVFGVHFPVSAQTPDTTSAWRYLPLQIGNVWEYEQWVEDCPIFPYCESNLVGYERWTVERDSLVEDITYSVLRVDRFSVGGEQGVALQRLVRFDTLAVRGFRRGSGSEEPWPGFLPCPLDAPFGGQIDCDDGWEDVFVEASEEIEVEAAGGSETRTAKYYLSLGWSAYVAGVGLLADGFAEFGGSWITLSYARTREAMYGVERFPVANEDAPAPESAVSLVVYPNPIRDVTTVRFSLDRPQRVTLAVYDVLGRQVLTEDLGAQAASEASHRLDLGGLPAGLYVVRLTGEAGARATARIVRR